MALKRATVTLTTVNGPNGQAVGSIHLQTPSSPTRPVYLDSIAIDDSAATAQMKSLTVAEAYLDANSVVTEGQELFNVTEATGNLVSAQLSPDGVTWLPVPLLPSTNTGIVDENGASIASAYVRIPIRTAYLTVRVDGGATGDVFTAYVSYETAGDWRF